MKTMVWMALASATLMMGAACKKTDSAPQGSPPTEIDKGNADLVDARARYTTAAKERLARIDARIDDLSQRADAESKEAVAKLRARRDQVAASLDALSHQAASGWETLKQDVDHGVDAIEKDVNTALK